MRATGPRLASESFRPPPGAETRSHDFASTYSYIGVEPAARLEVPVRYRPFLLGPSLPHKAGTTRGFKPSRGGSGPRCSCHRLQAESFEQDALAARSAAPLLAGAQ